MSGLQELGQLHLLRPSATAPPAVVAAWHERRAETLEHLAAEGTPAAHDLAVSARQYATRLREAA